MRIVLKQQSDNTPPEVQAMCDRYKAIEDAIDAGVIPECLPPEEVAQMLIERKQLIEKLFAMGYATRAVARA